MIARQITGKTTRQEYPPESPLGLGDSGPLIMRGVSSLCFKYLLVSAAVAMLLVAVLLVGCGGTSGGSGGGGGSPTGPMPFVILTPDSGAAPSVTMGRGAGTSGADLQLEIAANDLQNVGAMDFVLAYPGQLMRVVDVRSGPFLGAAPSIQAVALSGNRLQVSLTRLEVGSADGSGLIVVVDLEGLAVGNGRLDFINPTADAPDGTELLDILWLGAGIQVSP